MAENDPLIEDDWLAGQVADKLPPADTQPKRRGRQPGATATPNRTPRVTTIQREIGGMLEMANSAFLMLKPQYAFMALKEGTEPGPDGQPVKHEEVTALSRNLAAEIQASGRLSAAFQRVSKVGPHFALASCVLGLTLSRVVMWQQYKLYVLQQQLQAQSSNGNHPEPEYPEPVSSPVPVEESADGKLGYFQS